ncbi:chemotaxis protein methyltransferase [Halobacillus andaensis]|uniref:protein-glutamate O-methyltransferase n=1 Tax=Halobacillus andaensis TaxID=1176239 RepID=A0A917EUV1_HALAA|nr:protein-glutamate O-methyltransferase CheR [Halobacillus andaensis]MBP2003269.1 chemotaxis protein methyltransferase CheR [Halobacillus andaensis]GGF09392.1 chemotaxis protein methyltransferase [Halobacillus andaensis]
MNNDYDWFVQQLKRKSGIDLLYYKEAQMKRRLTALRVKRGFHNFSAYFNAVLQEEELFQELLDRLTINVSEFYRNKKRWEVLEHKVLPHLLKKQGKLKIWSAACSTGEEPYTLAMIVNKYLPSRNFQVIATDLDENALKRAEMGVYPERSLKEVPEDMVKKHFKKEDFMYRINDEVKRNVTFTKHNLLADEYGHNYDLIVCRNVLIYFTEQAKQMIYQKFSQSLKENGVFFVGSTEQIFSPQHYDFKLFDTFFYQKELTAKK